jgi:hypothetical protein
MKPEFIFIALPASALIAPSAFAVQYLTVEQAQKAIFPSKSFTAAPVKLTSIQRKAIEQASGVRLLHDEQQVWRVSGGGWFIVDQVVGKHEFITYAAGLNADGRSGKSKSWITVKPTVARFEMKNGEINLPVRRANRHSSSIATSKTSAERL